MFEGEDNAEIKNPFYENFEPRKQKEFLEKIMTDLKSISQDIDKISVDLKDDTQELIGKINANAAELEQLIRDEAFDDQDSILSDLQNNLKELQPQLEQLPYSNRAIINNLCKMINTLLKKLADFFAGPIVGEGLYIPRSSQPHEFKFFHPSNSVNPSIEDLSEAISSFSTSPRK